MAGGMRMRERSFKMRAKRCSGLGLALALLTPLACGGKAMNGSAAGECQPGVHEVCACPENNTGVQRCRADRTYEACMCPMVGSSKPSGDGDAASGPGAGGAGMGGPTKTGGSGGSAGSSGGAMVAGVAGSGASGGTGGSKASAGAGGFVDTAGTGGFVDTAGTGGFVDTAGTGGTDITAGSAGFGGSGGDSPVLAACTKVCDDAVGLMCKLQYSCVSSCVQVFGWTEYPADYQTMLDCWATQLSTAQYECFTPGDFLISAPLSGTSCEAASCKWTCEDASYGAIRIYNRCGCQ